MPLDVLALYFKLPTFALVASRLGGLILFQPILSSLAVPINLRALFVLALASLVTPMVSAPAEPPASAGALAIAAAGELALGLLMGSLVMTVFLGLQVGGLLVAQESGLAFGQIANPSTDEEDPVLSVFYMQLGMLAFLTLGGHRAVVTAVLRTFQTLPPMAVANLDGGVELLTDAIALGCEVGVRIAAPAVIALFLVNIALGFISRTMPQLNIATVGFSLKSLIAFVIMAVSLPTAMNAFADQLDATVVWIETLVDTAGPGS